MANLTLGFDVYGTLVDPLEVQQHLRILVGDKAAEFARIWREKQVEYSWRKSLMQRYEDFGVCTRQALDYAMLACDAQLDEPLQQQLMLSYRNLSAYPDVKEGLMALKEAGHRLFAFSNGTAAMVRALLSANGLLEIVEDVVSVDEVGVFKPAPEVYWHLCERAASAPKHTWLISSNPWDVMGAKSAGICAAWLKRDPGRIYDPWGIEPDIRIDALGELAGRLVGERV